MSVSATDKSTGKKQSITIRSSGGLSDADVEEMVQKVPGAVVQHSRQDGYRAEVYIAELEDSTVKTTEI